MSALDDLLSDFTSNAGTMPAVNPPEAAKVLATQTAPEVAGEPEPAPAATNGDRLETAIRFIAMHAPKGATITIQGESLKGSAHQLGELIFADQAGP